MQLKLTKHVRADGSPRTQVHVVEGYRPSPGANPKQRIVRNYGYLEDQENPKEFLAGIKAEIEENRKQKKQIDLKFDSGRGINDPANRDLYYAPFLLEILYRKLELEEFFKKHRTSKAEYDLNAIFKYLVSMRCMNADSKRTTYANLEHVYLADKSFMLEDIYRALDEISALRFELQEHLNGELGKILPSDKEYLYLDTTNFYFEKDFAIEDTLPQKGVSKEHRTEPIVQYGLVLDSNGLPLLSEAYPGNTSDCLILQPLVTEVRGRHMAEGRVVVVADKGLNSGKNVDYLCNEGDGFLFSQVLRGKKGQRYADRIFNESLYTVNAKGTYKYQLFKEEYKGKTKEGKTVVRERLVLIYWSKKEADFAKKKREAKVARAKKKMTNNIYSVTHKADEYLKETLVDKDTGEILEPASILSVDEEKILEEEKYDGYFCLITSELDYSEKKMREVYHQLWKIEESFRIDKSDLDARPIFLHLDNRIRAHLLICHVALVFIRLIQLAIGKPGISAERIIRVFSNCVLDIPQNGVVHLHAVSEKMQFVSYIDRRGRLAYTTELTGFDEVSHDFDLVCSALGLSLSHAYLRQEQFNSLVRKAVPLL